MEYQYYNNRNDFFFDCLSLNKTEIIFSVKFTAFSPPFAAMLPIFQLYAHQYIIRANFFYCFDFYCSLWLTYDDVYMTNITRTCVKSLKLVC